MKTLSQKKGELLRHLKDYVRKEWGTRCKVKDTDCVLCRIWVMVDLVEMML